MSIIHNLLGMELVMTAGKKVSTVHRLLLMQALVIIVTTLGFLIFGSAQMAVSPGLGGLVAFLPNLGFAYRMQLASGKKAKQMVRSFYANEAIKIFLTAALFLIVFQVPEVNLLTLLAGYVAVVSVHWFALYLWRTV